MKAIAIVPGLNLLYVTTATEHSGPRSDRSLARMPSVMRKG